MTQITNQVVNLNRGGEHALPLNKQNAGYIGLAERKELREKDRPGVFYGQSAKAFAGLVTGLSQVLDRIAGLCMVAIMGLVVANIILRAVFKSPILGTYEYVGFLTAAMIGLALACCAVQDGHIAVSFVADRFPLAVQAIIDIAVNVIALCFWSLSAWHVAKYAHSMSVKGVVSSTTQTPFYHFVYLVAFGLFVLCLVLLVRVIESIKKAAINR